MFALNGHHRRRKPARPSAAAIGRYARVVLHMPMEDWPPAEELARIMREAGANQERLDHDLEIVRRWRLARLDAGDLANAQAALDRAREILREFQDLGAGERHVIEATRAIEAAERRLARAEAGVRLAESIRAANSALFPANCDG